MFRVDQNELQITSPIFGKSDLCTYNVTGCWQVLRTPHRCAAWFAAKSKKLVLGGSSGPGTNQGV